MHFFQLTEVALQSDCVQDQQCSADISGSECFALKCRCKNDHDEYSGKCSKSNLAHMKSHFTATLFQNLRAPANRRVVHC